MEQSLKERYEQLSKRCSVNSQRAWKLWGFWHERKEDSKEYKALLKEINKENRELNKELKILKSLSKKSNHESEFKF